jgi:hypothetical protein
MSAAGAGGGAAQAPLRVPSGAQTCTTVFAPRPAFTFTWRLEGLTPAFFTDAAPHDIIKGPVFDAFGVPCQLAFSKTQEGEEGGVAVALGVSEEAPMQALFMVDAWLNGELVTDAAGDVFEPAGRCLVWSAFTHEDLLVKAAELLPGGVLTFTVTLRAQGYEERHRANPTIAVPPPALLTELGTLLASGRDADVTLLCGAERLAAHSFVLSLRSRIFAAQLEGPLAAPADAVPVPPEITPHTLRRLLQYLYTDELEPASPEEASHLLNAADHYAAPRLFAICERTLCSALSVDNAATTLTLAEQHGATALKHAALRFVAANALAVMATPGWLHLAAARPALMGEALHTVVAGAPPEPPPREPPAAEDGAGAAAEGGDDTARRVRRRVR